MICFTRDRICRVTHTAPPAATGHPPNCVVTLLAPSSARVREASTSVTRPSLPITGDCLSLVTPHTGDHIRTECAPDLEIFTLFSVPSPLPGLAGCVTQITNNIT